MRHPIPQLWAILAFVTIFGAALEAQTNNWALVPTSVIHKPTQAEAGPYLVQNVPIGDGKKFDNDIPRITTKCIALAGATTHDLILVHNISARDLVFEGRKNAPALASPPNPPNINPDPYLVSSRPKYDNPAKPEAIMPGNNMQQVWGFDQSIVVPANSTVPVIMFVSDWIAQLDTSPRDYVLTFGLWEVSQAQAELYTFEVQLTIPGPTGGKGQTACSANDNGGPAGLIVLAVAGMAAILPRRIKLLVRK